MMRDIKDWGVIIVLILLIVLLFIVKERISANEARIDRVEDVIREMQF